MGNKIKITLDLRRKKKDGTYPIVIEIRNKDKIRIATSYSALPENWDDGQFKKNESNYTRKNLVLRSMYDKVERVLLEISEERKFISDKELRALINKNVSNKQAPSNNFISYLDCFLELKSNAGTRSVYEGTRNKILVFDKGCTFETIDRNWLSRFEKWMIDSGMKTNAYAIHLRNIRAVFNYAIDEEITTLYPFRKFKIRKEETRKRSLTVEQLRQLRDYPCEPYQERYRDMFMLMFYLIGVNAVDLFNAKKLVNGRLEYKRAKTGKLYSIKVEPEAMGIIEKYKGKKYLLNVLDEYGNYKDFLHRMGIGLKQIGECKRSGLGGKKHITPLFPDISSYWARHTWATIAASLDVPKETIAAALGHEIGMSVTSIYINFDMRKVDEANRLVLDKIKDRG
ncbi:site-specific integrase [Bacteroides heparinolyticus]|uniref:site-specific integrase n=1 Tax=Prevotella heparinolytica TaxID=28113 RepID=UPI0023F6414C|nr:site-specific integrase [Bacteroides heparinolyticus]MCI6213265.1 site-specific integrase [Bacteroides heparinolyticus]